MYEIKRNGGGWGGTYNPRTTRPYAVVLNGELLRTWDGKIRTFSSRAAAEKAAEKALSAAGRYVYRGHVIEEVSFDAGESRPRWNITRDGDREACDAADSLRQAKAMIDGWQEQQGKPLIEIL